MVEVMACFVEEKITMQTIEKILEYWNTLKRLKDHAIIMTLKLENPFSIDITTKHSLGSHRLQAKKMSNNFTMNIKDLESLFPTGKINLMKGLNKFSQCIKSLPKL